MFFRAGTRFLGFSEIAMMFLRAEFLSKSDITGLRDFKSWEQCQSVIQTHGSRRRYHFWGLLKFGVLFSVICSVQPYLGRYSNLGSKTKNQEEEAADVRLPSTSTDYNSPVSTNSDKVTNDGHVNKRSKR